MRFELCEEDAAFPFQADSVDVCRYLHTFSRKEFAEPEMRLMLVVLEDALKSLEKYALARGQRGKALFHETEDWVFSTDEDWVFF